MIILPLLTQSRLPHLLIANGLSVTNILDIQTTSLGNTQHVVVRLTHVHIGMIYSMLTCYVRLMIVPMWPHLLEIGLRICESSGYLIRKRLGIVILVIVRPRAMDTVLVTIAKFATPVLMTSVFRGFRSVSPMG